ncbi:unnamed protein product [Chilo suppressalis]|uniref:50S ribosomal protein L34 n=1 Tax=Chilo suppressalis TaxID=168631 RepID=A0ABN8B5R4_CHISP|nr:unnamed protein product [Chilo suppressalis]
MAALFSISSIKSSVSKLSRSIVTNTSTRNGLARSTGRSNGTRVSRLARRSRVKRASRESRSLHAFYARVRIRA